MESQSRPPWKTRVAALFRGEWSKIGILDLAQLTLAVGGICAGIFFVSPELAALLDIRDRLDPALELEDRMYVKRVGANGSRLEVELAKLVTRQDVTYQAWVCGGAGLARMSFVGSGVLGPQEDTVSLSSALADGVNVALLQFTTESAQFTKVERWDVRRAVRESPTLRLRGIHSCDEIDENEL